MTRQFCTKSTAAFALLVGLAVPLGGCAINKLRNDYASTVSSAAIDAHDGAQHFLGRVEIERQETNIDLAVADPACAQIHSILRNTPDIRVNRPDIGFLCIVGDNNSNRLGYALSSTPITDDLEPTLKLLDALAAYGNGLSSIIDGKHDDAAKPLLDALDLAHAAQDALNAVVPDSPNALPSTSDARVVAAANLINFLGELLQEANDVKKLRSYVLAHPDGVQSIIEPLRRQIGSWERARKGDAGLRLIVVAAEARRTLDLRPLASAQVRRTALEKFYAQQALAHKEAQIEPALIALLDAVVAADADLRRVLKDHPNLSQSERAQVGALNRTRIIIGLGHLTALAKALRGV